MVGNGVVLGRAADHRQPGGFTMPRLVHPMSYKIWVVGVEVSEDVLFERADVPERRTVLAGIGEQIGSVKMSVPDHLVRDSVDVV